MKHIMKKQHLITFILASFFIIVSIQGAYVSAAISGDEICGSSTSTKCGIADFKKISQGIFSAIISIGLPLLVVFIIYRFVMAWYSLQQGNASAYKEATKKAGQAILGFLIVVAIMGGLFITMLNFLGVDAKYTDLLKKVSSKIEIIPRAYAARVPAGACATSAEGTPCVTSGKDGFCTKMNNGTCEEILTGTSVLPSQCATASAGWPCTTYEGTSGACIPLAPARCMEILPVPADVEPTSSTPMATQLPNPIGVTSLYDFILSVLSLVMKFFIYPALIAMWVWSGFSYVLAQGAPEKLSKTHKLLMWAFVSTLVVFMTQGFLSSLKGSVQKILPTTTQGP